MNNQLTWLDIIIIAIPLAFVIAVGLVMRRYTNSVAGYLAANRCAGRYLITTASSEMGSAIIGIAIALEIFSQTGFSLEIWNNFGGVIGFMLTLFGVITYRFRETRCLTFHQFFEIRYSKGLRVFASFINIFAGLINFGLVPAVGARFFVYFCGLPEHLNFWGITAPTFAVLMVGLMIASLLLALSGGQISVMVTDCIEALVSSIFYLIVAFFLLSVITLSQAKEALLSGPPGGSYINPFDIGNRHDFNGWYVVLFMLLNLSYYRGTAWNQGFNAAAKSAHEGKMAAILASWRGYAASSMGVMIAIGAFTLMHHPDFAAQRQLVINGVQNLDGAQLKTQMTMPFALGLLLVPGIKGCFCAIGLFGLLASQGIQLHNQGSTLLQDVILPLRKKPLEPKTHVLALRLSAVFVGTVVCFFSLFFKPVDYLQMMVTLIGAIYLGGIGPIVWGGFYWKKGTTAGAWTSMIIGSSMATVFNIVQQFWTSLDTFVMRWSGEGPWTTYLAQHAEKCPVNGIQFSAITVVCCFIGYIAVSLFTSRENFNVDRMLHRGAYALPSEAKRPADSGRKGFSWGKLIGIDEEYTLNDKILSVGTFFYIVFWQLLAVGIVIWSVVKGRLSDEWWFTYALITGIAVPIVLGVITTIWFTYGTVGDLRDLFGMLQRSRPNAADDGTVINHHNLDEGIADRR